MVQLSYIKELLDNDYDFQKACSGDLVILELSESQHQLPLLSYAISVLLTGKTALTVLAKFSYFQAVKQLNIDGVDLANMYFIDCVSKKQALEYQDSSHVVELEQSTQLQTVFGTLLDHTDEFTTNTFTCFDDVVALKNMTEKDRFLRFFHLLLTKLRNKNVGGFMIMPKGVFDDDGYAEMKQLVDKVIHV
jgi:hypothetical protein